MKIRSPLLFTGGRFMGKEIIEEVVTNPEKYFAHFCERKDGSMRRETLSDHTALTENYFDQLWEEKLGDENRYTYRSSLEVKYRKMQKRSGGSRSIMCRFFMTWERLIRRFRMIR